MALSMAQTTIAKPFASRVSTHRAYRCTRVQAAATPTSPQGLEVNRRQAALAGAAAISVALAASPALAFLGIGEDGEQRYVNDTSSIIKNVKNALEVTPDDPVREDVIKKVRKETNDWVARYRREASYAGRPSYGNTYSALNALAGHFNSFGVTAPIPKKRLDRIQKELDDAERLLARGR